VSDTLVVAPFSVGAVHQLPDHILWYLGGGGSIGAFVPVLFGKETVGQLETVTEPVPGLA
jgi:hypothetical protein